MTMKYENEKFLWGVSLVNAYRMKDHEHWHVSVHDQSWRLTSEL